jgi:hypothetical protein
MPDQFEQYYKYLKANGADVAPDFNSFKGTLSNYDNASKYYSYLKDNQFDVPETYDSFADTFGLKKKDQAVSPSVSSPTQSLSPDFKKGKAFAEKGFLMQAEGTKAPKKQKISIEPSLSLLGMPKIKVLEEDEDPSILADFTSSAIKGQIQGKVANILSAGKRPSPEELGEIAQLQTELQSFPQSKAEKAYQEKGLKGIFKDSPGLGVQFIAETITSSLSSLFEASKRTVPTGVAMGAAAGAPFAGIGALPGAATGFLASQSAAGYNISTSQDILNSLSENGVDISNKESLINAFSDEKKMAKIRSTAAKYGVPILVFDALTAGFAGKFAAGAVGKSLSKKLLAGLGETGLQITGGSGGELAAQIASGKKVNWDDIIIEGIAEVPGGVTEVATGVTMERSKTSSNNKTLATQIATQGVQNGVEDSFINLNRDLANNVITPEQHQEGIIFTEKAAQVADKIPETVTGENRAKSIELLVERNDINQANQNLLQQKQTTDVAYHAGIDQEIKTNEERIKKIDAEVYNIAKKPSKEFGGKKYIVDGEEVSQAEFEALQGKPVGTKKVVKAIDEYDAIDAMTPEESQKFADLTAQGKSEEASKMLAEKLEQLKAEVKPTEVEVTEEVKPTEDVYFNKLQKSEKFDDNSSVSTYLGDDKGEKNIFYTLPNKGIISFKEIKNNTNRFSLTANAKNDKPLDIKNAFKRIEKFLPANHELIEDKSISVDGLRVWNNFIKNDKYIKTGETKEVEITPIDKTNLFKDLKYNTEGKWNGAKFENKDEALARLEKYLKNNNLNFKVKIDGDFIKVEVPVLKYNPSKEVKPTEVPSKEANKAQTEVKSTKVTEDNIEVEGLDSYTSTAKSGKFYNIFGKRKVGDADEMWWIRFSRKNNTNTLGYAIYRNVKGEEKKISLNELPKSLIEIYNNPIAEVKPTEVKVEVKPTELAPIEEKKESFTTKSGRQKVAYEKGQLIVRDAKTGKEVSPSTRKKALDEYIDKFDFNKGERFTEVVSEMPSGLSDEEGKRFIIENSKNPLEVLETYVAEPKESKLTTEEQLIADYGLGKLTQKGFERFGDENLITGGMALTYFNKEGTPIDVRAKEMSDYYGKEITPQDIVNFMIAYPSGASQAVRMGESRVAREAAEKFKELTGIDLNSTVAEKIIDAEIAKAEAFEQELIKQEYETREQLEAEYYKASEEADRLAEEGDSATAKPAKKAEKTTETELAKEYKEVVGKASKKAKENAKKEFVDRNFDNIVEKLKIQIKCPT